MALIVCWGTRNCVILYTSFGLVLMHFIWFYWQNSWDYVKVWYRKGESYRMHKFNIIGSEKKLKENFDENMNMLFRRTDVLIPTHFRELGNNFWERLCSFRTPWGWSFSKFGIGLSALLFFENLHTHVEHSRAPFHVRHSNFLL